MRVFFILIEAILAGRAESLLGTNMLFTDEHGEKVLTSPGGHAIFLLAPQRGGGVDCDARSLTTE